MCYIWKYVVHLLVNEGWSGSWITCMDWVKYDILCTLGFCRESIRPSWIDYPYCGTKTFINSELGKDIQEGATSEMHIDGGQASTNLSTSMERKGICFKEHGPQNRKGLPNKTDWQSRHIFQGSCQFDRPSSEGRKQHRGFDLLFLLLLTHGCLSCFSLTPEQELGSLTHMFSQC